MKYTPRKPEVKVFVRHSANCPAVDLGDYHRKCECVKWMRWSGRDEHGAPKQFRENCETRIWAEAERKCEAKQNALDGTPASSKAAPSTIERHVRSFVDGKVSEELSTSVTNRHAHRLADFVRFMAAQNKFYPADITKVDLTEYQKTWPAWAKNTRRGAVTDLRSFLRYAGCKEAAEALKRPKLTREDKDARLAKPYTEAELERMIKHCGIVFADDPVKAARLRALIKVQSSTGMAVRDAIKLEHTNIVGNVLTFHRQKTGVKVIQKLDADLVALIRKVPNTDSRYVFYDGKTMPAHMTHVWQAALRAVVKSAECYTVGDVSHRLRDSAANFWFSQGYTVTQVAALLGDTIAICEKHYANLPGAMAASIELLPKRKWAAAA